MPSQPKIKFSDYPDLRIEIDQLNDNAEQVTLAKWAINCAKHILPLAKNENIDFSVIETGFEVNEQWQVGNTTVNEVRKAGFKIHAIARECETSEGKHAIRTAGQAVAVGHMKEHAMVCADYAIKTIGLAFPNDLNKIKEEREWQLATLEKYISEC
jgi:hypothetical protein